MWSAKYPFLEIALKNYRIFSQISFFYLKVQYIHTYIIGHYNPSVRIIDLVSHTTSVVCVNFIHKWRDLQFKVDSDSK